MTDNYAAIVQGNLDEVFRESGALERLATCLPAEVDGGSLRFAAFGGSCRISPEGVFLDDQPETGPRGIILSLYARHAAPDAMIETPLKAFKEFPNSGPYAGAFASHTQNILVPHVDKIEEGRDAIVAAMDGCDAPAEVGGDFSFLVKPLPKITLCYIFYEADEDFPASVTCLYSANAHLFLPIDGLADVGEYCAKRMIELIR